MTLRCDKTVEHSLRDKACAVDIGTFQINFQFIFVLIADFSIEIPQVFIAVPPFCSVCAVVEKGKGIVQIFHFSAVQCARVQGVERAVTYFRLCGGLVERFCFYVDNAVQPAKSEQERIAGAHYFD
ncbi:hypothetical protein Barb6_03527 [Bacteroidales bacterium Barb6]|nr:hypothetical protein Barb6_03527 [Bacteroidales bacterium Barb6]